MLFVQTTNRKKLPKYEQLCFIFGPSWLEERLTAAAVALWSPPTPVNVVGKSRSNCTLRALLGAHYAIEVAQFFGGRPPYLVWRFQIAGRAKKTASKLKTRALNITDFVWSSEKGREKTWPEERIYTLSANRWNGCERLKLGWFFFSLAWGVVAGYFLRVV